MPTNNSMPFYEITPKRVYFIGIGGIGMSALARWFASQKWAVFGSDATESEITRELKKDLVKVKIGQKEGNLGPKIGLFIYNWAISKDNPEFSEASKSDTPLIPYAKALGKLTRAYRTFAVSGAHGKSTTASLISLALIKGKSDPTVIIGTKLKEFGNKNFRKGKSDILVIEADEYHDSFLNYSPSVSVITNVDREHLDWYGNISNIKKSFLSFIKNTKRGGTVIVNKDNDILFSMKKTIEVECKKKNISVIWYSLKDKSAKKIKANLSHLPGDYMVSNALGAYYAARQAGISETAILNAFRKYKGAWRRMEYKGQIKIKNSKFKIHLYDDYAHHPTEIRATLSGAKTFFKNKDIICVFEPHQTKRLKLLFKEFTNAFDSADHLFLLPVYKVAGRDSVEKKYTSENLARIIQRKKQSVFYLKNKKDLKKSLFKFLRKTKKDVVVIMMGAGTINEETKKLLRK